MPVPKQIAVEIFKSQMSNDYFNGSRGVSLRERGHVFVRFVGWGRHLSPT